MNLTPPTHFIKDKSKSKQYQTSTRVPVPFYILSKPFSYARIISYCYCCCYYYYCHSYCLLHNDAIYDFHVQGKAHRDTTVLNLETDFFFRFEHLFLVHEFMANSWLATGISSCETIEKLPKDFSIIV